MDSAEEPVRFAGAELDRHRHVCAFFRTADEGCQVTLPFLKEAVERGERACWIIDSTLREAHVRWLRLAGIDVAAAEQREQLELRRWADAYLRDGHFDGERMLAVIQEILDEGRRRGFPLTRLVANMEWALEDRPGVEGLVAYEARLNYVLPRYKDPVICTYDTAKFGGRILIDILRTHPMTVIGGIVQENPFFTPPDEFLRELNSRQP